LSPAKGRFGAIHSVKSSSTILVLVLVGALLLLLLNNARLWRVGMQRRLRRVKWFIMMQ
jgi:hypothetical protein